MKDLTQTLHHEGAAELQAKKAIQKIKKMVEERYPVMESVTKNKLIIECLIEVMEERRYRAAS